MMSFSVIIKILFSSSFSCHPLFFFSFLFYSLQFRQTKEIDFSQLNFPREIWFAKPSVEIAYKLIILVPIILCGIIGNLLLLNIVFRNRALHTPTNYILVNMIAADTLTLIACPVMFICSDFFQNFVLGPLGCRMDGFLQGFLFKLKFQPFFGLSETLPFFFPFFFGSCVRPRFLLGIF